ncbi:MAG: hypothetical protein D8B41_01525 [Porphyromonas sp.]|nr:MAG: hypothetical protein D8B41_01525 [Porphyromonas sp.]
MDNLDSQTSAVGTAAGTTDQTAQQSAVQTAELQQMLAQLLQQQQGNQQGNQQPQQTAIAPAATTGVPQVAQPAVTQQPAAAPNLGFELSTGTQAAIQVLGAIGVDGNAVQNLAQEALVSGQPLNLAAFQQQFGNNAAYALQAAQSLLSDAQQYTQRVQQEAYSKVGGEQQWNQLTQQFKATAPHLHEAAQQLVNSNQLDAAVALMRSVVPQQGVMQPMQGALQQQVAGGVPQGFTEAQFVQAVQKLRTQYPNASFETGTAGMLYQELLNRRIAGKQAGL